MRNVLEPIKDAITKSASYRMYVKAIIDPGRIDIQGLSTNDPYAEGDYSEITDEPVGQCLYISPRLEKPVNIVVGESNQLFAIVEGESPVALGVSAMAGTKPAAKIAGNNVEIYYWNSVLKKSIFDQVTFSHVSTTDIDVNYVPSEWTIVGGSPHVLNNGQLALTYQTSIGGIGCAYYDNARWQHWENRFMSPNEVTTTYWTIYSTAVYFDAKVFFYITDMDTGEVRGTNYYPYYTSWSDSFIAMPADLSRFCISNAFVANEYVHIAGQFHRTDDLESATKYSLLLMSRNARTFSWNRDCYLSDLGYQFHAVLDNGTRLLHVADRGCFAKAEANYYLVSSPIGQITIGPPHDIIAFGLTGDNTGDIRVKGHDEIYLDHPTIRIGSRVQLYIGYDTANGIIYQNYNEYIISSVGKGFDSNNREIEFSITEANIFRMSQLAFPFYAEITSRTTSRDDCSKREKLYPTQTLSPYAEGKMIIDFWANMEWAGDGLENITPFSFRAGKHTGCENKDLPALALPDRYGVRTSQLNNQYLISGYPLTTGEDVTASLYGWERGDTEARDNSTWRMYAVIASASNPEDKTVVEGHCISTYQKFPKDWPDVQSGDYPIQYEWSDTYSNALDPDLQVLYFAFTIENDDAIGGRANPERLEVLGLDFTYRNMSSSRGWEIFLYPKEDVSSSLQMPDTGIPNILFMVSPYTAFEFSIQANFHHIAGDQPINIGTVAWGVVGLGKNGTNCVVGRYNKLRSRMEIIKLRNGVETVLAYTNSDTVYEVKMEHRGGTFVLYGKQSNTWVVYVTYKWNEVIHGSLSNSTQQIMHVGVYGAAASPGFLAAGFNVASSDGITMIAGFNPQILDSFPASNGIVVVNGIKYKYTGKIAPKGVAYGPYQGRQTSNHGTYTRDWGSFTGTALEIALYQPNRSQYDLSGLIMGSENGFNWYPLINTEWQVIHSTAGQPDYLRDRSRHYFDNATGNFIGPPHRVYLNCGLHGIEAVEAEAIYRHVFGSFVSVYGTDKIYLLEAIGSSLQSDATVKDMINYLCDSAAAVAEFPGDWRQNTVVLSTEASKIAPEFELFPGGMDLQFTMSLPTNGNQVNFWLDNVFIDETDKIQLGIKNNAGNLQLISMEDATVATTEIINTSIGANRANTFRILLYGGFLGLYVNNVSLAIFVYGEERIDWPEERVDLYADATTTIGISDVIMAELFDWREAIYVESEMNAQSALSSVIQERPVEMLVRNGLSFSYFFDEDNIRYVNELSKRNIIKHRSIESYNPEAGSDAIIYYRDIAYAKSPEFLKRHGFLTRVYKLSSMDHGAKMAGKLLLKRAYEKQFAETIDKMRPDVRLQEGDRLELEYVLAGTQRKIKTPIIIRSISMNMQEGNYYMTIIGYKDSTDIQSGSISAYLEGGE